jgi:transcriptional regulator with XRE-family HTH domain
MLSKLREIQKRESLTDSAMADRLGIGRSTWTELRNGRLPLSERVQMRAVRAWPELLAELLGTVSTGAQTPSEAA